MPSPFAHFFDRWLPDAIRNLTNNELHSQDAVISWLQEALYENERTEGWRLYFTRRGGARELPPRAPRSARGGRLLPAAPGRATAAGGERQIGEGLGKPGFPSPLPEDDARPDPPAGGEDGETRFPHTPARGLRPHSPVDEGMGKPGFPIPLLKWQSVATKVTAPLPSPPPLGAGHPAPPPSGGRLGGGLNPANDGHLSQREARPRGRPVPAATAHGTGSYAPEWARRPPGRGAPPRRSGPPVPTGGPPSYRVASRR